MDWTEYPKNGLTSDTAIDSTTMLAAFLGLPNPQVLDLIDQADTVDPLAVDGLAVPFTREVTAWRGWQAIDRDGTVADLLVALADVPDPQAPPPGEPQLTPIVVDRMQISKIDTSYVTLRYRPAAGQPLVTAQFTTNDATVEVDSSLIGVVSPVGARVTVYVSAQDPA